MENMGVLAVAGCIISAAAVFVFMQFRRYEEQQDASNKILKATTDFESTKTKLLGYTKFNDSLPAVKPHLCLLYTSPSPRDRTRSRMPSSA